MFVAPVTAALLSLLAACSGEDDAAPATTIGTPAGGFGGVAGMSTAGVGGGGSAGTSAGAAGDASTIPATFETVKLVLGGGGSIMTCAAAPCHGVGGAAPPADPLALPSNDDQLLYTSLLSYVSKACNGMKLVEPGNPAQSALVTILEGPCGATPRMPYGCTEQAGDCIPAEYVAAVAQWIESGAPQQ